MASTFTRPTRRQFLHTTAAASTVFSAPAFLRGQNLNDKLNVAVIGTGGRGNSNMNAVAGSENVVAICDVNGDNLARAASRFNGADHPLRLGNARVISFINCAAARSLT